MSDTNARSLMDQLAGAVLSDADLNRRREAVAAQKMLSDHDAARARAPKITLVAITSFTIVDDDNPEGRVVDRGDEFEISEFDLPRYRGRGLPPVDTRPTATAVTVNTTVA